MFASALVICIGTGFTTSGAATDSLSLTTAPVDSRHLSERAPNVAAGDRWSHVTHRSGSLIGLSVAGSGLNETLVARSERCPRSAIRHRVGDRRKATWRWQGELGYPHTRTSYRERVAIGCAYLRWVRALWAERADHFWREYVELQSPVGAICHVFGVYCSEALRVAECESGKSRHAVNGQYLGIFQMGESERRLYGHGETFLAQARAAYRYFKASGRDWSPWSCKPR